MALELSLREAEPIAQQPGYIHYGVLLLVTGMIWVVFFLGFDSLLQQITRSNS